MDLGIRGKAAIVTGAGQGIGKAAALSLAAEGVKICINDINAAHGEQTAAEMREAGFQAVFIGGDVSNESDVNAMFAHCAKELGGVDILVNNAAISPKVPFEEITAEDFSRVMQINLLGSFLCAKQAFSYMKEQKWGRIISLSSMAGRFGANKAGVHYSSTKAGIIGMTMTLAKKMGPYNITVNCIAPGRIDTALTRILPAETIEQIVQQIPLGRIGSSDEVASVITFLASEKASYVTGACVDVLGGFIA